MSVIKDAVIETGTPETVDQVDTNEGGLETESPEVTNQETGAEEVEENNEPEVEEDGENVPDNKKKADTAFAEMRRKNAELEEKLANVEREKQLADKLSEIENVGKALGLTDEEIESLKEEGQDNFKTSIEIENIKSEKEKLEEINAELMAERMIREDLAEIQAIDKNVKTVEDLNETYFKLRTSVDEKGEFNLTAKEAFIAMQAINGKKPKPPKEVGSIGETHSDKSYFSREDVANMSDEEIHRNLEKIEKSQASWK